MYCKFSAVSSNVVDVISILVSEIMVVKFLYRHRQRKTIVIGSAPAHYLVWWVMVKCQGYS